MVVALLFAAFSLVVTLLTFTSRVPRHEIPPSATLRHLGRPLSHLQVPSHWLLVKFIAHSSRRFVNVQVIGLDEAPQGYKDFDQASRR